MEASSGAVPTEVIELAGAPFHMTAWSPDGSWIAYTDHVSGFDQIFIVNPESGVSVWLAGGNGEDASSPTWSPDGSQIAYVGHTSGGYNIWTMQADGRSPTQLTTVGDDHNPSWSPDGEKIAYSSYQEGTGQLWVVPATGGDPVQLTFTAGYSFAPAWSPDGSRIAYTLTSPDRIKDVWIRAVE
jgi:Tol biopolymer transport system component